MTDQSDAGGAGKFSRRTNQTQEVRASLPPRAFELKAVLSCGGGVTGEQTRTCGRRSSARTPSS
eukprot:73132-Pyramimonas_sp.AAC.1